MANGDNIIWSESEISETGFCHSEYLHLLIKRCIEKTFGKSKSAVKEISAVALAGGPGSYTGLRIGASAAKGLALKSVIKQDPGSGLSSETHQTQVSAEF